MSEFPRPEMTIALALVFAWHGWWLAMSLICWGGLAQIIYRKLCEGRP